MSPDVLRAVPGWLLWTAAGVLLWWITLSSMTLAEFLLAVTSSAICSAWAVAARRPLGVRWGRPVLRPAVLAALAGQVVTGTARLYAAVVPALARGRQPESAPVRLRPGRSGPVTTALLVNATPPTVAHGPDAEGWFAVDALPGHPEALEALAGPGTVVERCDRGPR